MDPKIQLATKLTKKFLDVFKDELPKLDDLFKQVVSGFTRQLSLEDAAISFNHAIDVIIVREELQGNTFAGGELTFSYVSEQLCHSKLELYFQDTNKKWLKRTAENESLSTKYFTTESLTSLQNKGKVTFEVEAPDEPTRLAIKQQLEG